MVRGTFIRLLLAAVLAVASVSDGARAQEIGPRPSEGPGQFPGTGGFPREGGGGNHHSNNKMSGTICENYTFF